MHTSATMVLTLGPSCFHLFMGDCGTALFQIRYSAVSWPLRFSPLIFFFLCGCILRGAMSFGMLVSIFEMFWNDVCIHLHSQVQIEPWICKFRADVCGSLCSARFIEEFVYTRMHIHTRTHTYICRFSLTPSVSTWSGRTTCLKPVSKSPIHLLVLAY